jgi:hypothetical protein
MAFASLRKLHNLLAQYINVGANNVTALVAGSVVRYMSPPRAKGPFGVIKLEQ